MKTPVISIKCIESLEEIHSLRTLWEELHKDSIVSSIYNSFLFIYESIQVFENNEVTKKIFTLTDDTTNQLIAIFPLQQYKNTYNFIHLYSLETTALNNIMDKPFPIIRNGFHDVCWQAFFSHLKTDISDWDHMHFRDVPSSFPALELLPKICKQHDLVYQVDYDTISTEIDVEGKWDDFWNKHRTVRRNTRKLEKKFGDRLAFTIHDGNWKWCLDQYIALENKTWKKGMGVTENDKSILFYNRFCERLSKTKQLQFGFLTIDDVPIAGVIAYTHDDTVYFPQGCYDPAYKKYSPNMVNISSFLKYYFDTNYKNVDFLCGYADFVNKWTDMEIKTYDINIYKKRPAVQLLLAGQTFSKSVIGFIRRIRNV